MPKTKPTSRSFSDYADAFNALDADAIVASYRYPLSVITNSDTLIYKTEADFKPAIERLLKIYRLHKFKYAKIARETVVSEIGGIRTIDVQWALFDKNDAVILEFDLTYFQKTDIDGQPFIAAIAHNEMEKWQEKMAR